MAQFLGYQHVTQNTQIIYLTQAKLDEFKTKKLLGLKIIELAGDFTNIADAVLVLKDHGIAEIQSVLNHQDNTQTLRFKLK